MAGLISQSIKNMVAGVSQQPQILRMPDQAEEQINGYSSESHGLLKRPPTKHISRLNMTDVEVNNSLVHFINRDRTEQYVAFITPYTNAPVSAMADGVPTTRGRTLTQTFKFNGMHTPEVPVGTVKIEAFILGGGGGGGGDEDRGSSDGSESYVIIQGNKVAAAGGGRGWWKRQGGAGGAPNGNAGGTGTTNTPGLGGYPVGNVFGGETGRGGSGHRDYDYVSGGGGGSGAYVHHVFTLTQPIPAEIIVSVGAGGNAGASDGGSRDWGGSAGQSGAVRLVYYIEDVEGGGTPEPILESAIRVFNLKGEEFPVTATAAAASYLNVTTGANIQERLRAITVADYTFILNREVPVKMTDKRSPVKDKEALVYVKQGNYGKNYMIMVNGDVKAAYQVPDGTSAAHSVNAATDFITNELSKGLTSNGFTYSRGQNWIKLNLASETDKVTTSDGFGDQAMFAIKRKIQKVSDLPKTAPNGYVVEVAGDKTTSADNYWLKYSDEKKTWEECVAPNLEVEFDAGTLPVALRREADGTFHLTSLTWDERKVGDEGSCPIPSFVGNQIKDIFFYRNRLGFVADENVILSSSGRFFKFWNNSASTIVDTDPIDVAVSNNSVAILEHALPFNEELLLFAEQTQFIMRADGVLSPKSIRVDKATDFRNSPKVRPIGVGRNAYFLMEKTGNTDLIEYYPNEEGMMDGIPLTSHIPNYVPTGISSLIGATSENMLLLSGGNGGDARTVYVYKYLFTEQGRVQSAWSKWQFAAGSKVAGMAFVDAYIYLIVQSGSGVYLESMQTNPTVFEYPEQPWKIHLDRLAEHVIPATDDAYDFSRGSTLFNITGVYSAVPKSGDYYMVDGDGDTHPLTWNADGMIELYGDWRGKKVWIGEMFPFQYTFSRFLFKQEGQNGWVTETEGKLMLRRAYVNYSNSGAFAVRVNSLSTDNYRESAYTGRTMGTYANKLGRIPLGSGRFNYPIGREANDAEVTITSYNPYPVSFIGAGWEGLMARRTTKA